MQKLEVLPLAHRDSFILSLSEELPSPFAHPQTSSRVPMHDLINFVIGILDARDPFTFSHSWRVAEVSVLLGKKMGFSPPRLAELHHAAHLHDIGKIGVPDRVLLKEGPLTKEEYGEMKQHSRKGFYILRRFPLLRDIARIVLYHHERMDGKGYPQGISGEQIPLESRIIGVADAFDAITSDRPYRKGRSLSEAFEEIQRHRGTQFCPKTVDALLELRQVLPEHLRQADEEIRSFEKLPLLP